MDTRVSAVILAAGTSARMGRPKALLTLGGETFVEAIARTAADASIGDTVLVLGAEHERLLGALKGFTGRTVINRAWETGRQSSIVAGIDAVDREGCDGALIWPVDHPLVTARTVSAMLGVFREAPEAIVLPVWNGRRGHPIILPRRLFGDARRAPAEIGLRAVIHAHDGEVREIPAEEEGVLVNINTWQDYELYCMRKQ